MAAIPLRENRTNANERKKVLRKTGDHDIVSVLSGLVHLEYELFITVDQKDREGAYVYDPAGLQGQAPNL